MRSTLPVEGFHPDTVYLDTATYGLASDAVVDAMSAGLDRWRRGVARTAWYDEAVAASRDLFATIVGTDPSRVAIGSQGSVLVGNVAASLPVGSTVLAPDGEFTSVLFPFLAQEDRGVTVRTAPLADLAEAVDADTDLVAFSLVQSSDGRVADVDAIEEAARRHGAAILVDATQAAGWFPFDPGRFDYTVASAYKWLLCPRGVAFMVLGTDHAEQTRPTAAGWYAGEDPWTSIYGGPLRLATDARRYDVSPAWLAWLGARPALAMIADLGVERIHAHDVGLADRARHALGMDASASAIMTVPLSDTGRLTQAGITAAKRADSVRVGFHLYNSVADVDALLRVVAPAT